MLRYEVRTECHRCSTASNSDSMSPRVEMPGTYTFLCLTRRAPNSTTALHDLLRNKTNWIVLLHEHLQSHNIFLNTDILQDSFDGLA